MYWTNFWVHIFTLLLAPFAPKLVKYSRHSESLNIRKNCEIADIFLQWQRFLDFQTYFKDLLCLELLTNLGAKSAKRSAKMWTIRFYKSFFKNILLYIRSRLSKIRSVHTYVMARTVYFGWICTLEFRFIDVNRTVPCVKALIVLLSTASEPNGLGALANRSLLFSEINWN